MLSRHNKVKNTYSDPAKSTKLNFDFCRTIASSVRVTCSIITHIIACDRLLSAFIAVVPVTRRSIPRVRQTMASCAEDTGTSVAPIFARSRGRGIQVGRDLRIDGRIDGNVPAGGGEVELGARTWSGRELAQKSQDATVLM